MNKRHLPQEVLAHAALNQNTGCLEWTGALWASGYGRFQLNNRSVKAHRVAYELAHGPLTPDQCVLHRCDNRKCINVGHLFLGTRKDNNLDKTTKGRQTKGEQVNTAKVSTPAVLAIREDARTSKEVAADYGLTWGHVNKIRGGRAWGHV